MAGCHGAGQSGHQHNHSQQGHLLHLPGRAARRPHSHSHSHSHSHMMQLASTIAHAFAHGLASVLETK